MKFIDIGFQVQLDTTLYSFKNVLPLVSNQC